MLYDAESPKPVPFDHLEGGVGREVGGRFRKRGTYLYLWLIHVDAWQKTSQYCNDPPIKNKRL